MEYKLKDYYWVNIRVYTFKHLLYIFKYLKIVIEILLIKLELNYEI